MFIALGTVIDRKNTVIRPSCEREGGFCWTTKSSFKLEKVMGPINRPSNESFVCKKVSFDTILLPFVILYLTTNQYTSINIGELGLPTELHFHEWFTISEMTISAQLLFPAKQTEIFLENFISS